MADERDDESESPVEGVRIVDKDEAQAALDAGVAISRQSQGRLVSIVDMESDDKGPTWADTDEPSSVRIVGGSERVSSTLRMPETTASSTGSDMIDDDFDLLDLRASAEREDDDPVVYGDEPDRGLVTPPQTSSHNLPHWTETPSGEVPAALSDATPPHGNEPTSRWSLDDLSDASRLGDSDDEDLDAAFDALGEEPPLTHEQIADDEPEAPVEEVVAPTEDEAPKQKDLHQEWAKSIDVLEEKVESLKKASIVSRTLTAIAGIAIAIVAFSAGPMWALILSLAVVMLSAIEYFDALRRVGYRPATALGLLAIAGAMLGTYARGEAAIPLVFTLATFFTFLWYMTGVIKDSPTANISVTLLGVMWTGVFGSFAALLLRAPQHHGVAFLGGAVVLVIAYDTFAYLGGVLLGRHKLIPSISPGKTWEGLIVATGATIVVGTIVLPFIHPWGIWEGMFFGLVVAVVAPLGDLAESMVKRDLGLKDMGHLLPGHGGALDRFDALLFVLPATYYVVRMFNLI